MDGLIYLKEENTVYNKGVLMDRKATAKRLQLMASALERLDQLESAIHGSNTPNVPDVVDFSFGFQAQPNFEAKIEGEEIVKEIFTFIKDILAMQADECRNLLKPLVDNEIIVTNSEPQVQDVEPELVPEPEVIAPKSVTEPVEPEPVARITHSKKSVEIEKPIVNHPSADPKINKDLHRQMVETMREQVAKRGFLGIDPKLLRR